MKIVILMVFPRVSEGRPEEPALRCSRRDLAFWWVTKASLGCNLPHFDSAFL